MSLLTGKHVLVLGLGESGLAMARWCALRGARLRVADSRAAPPGLEALRAEAPLAELVTGAFGEEVLDGIDLVALSPGLDPRAGVAAAARRRGLPLTGEMSLLAQALDELGVRAQTRILAVTGTNGKTTTTALTAALAQSAGIDAVAAGNISPAALDVLMERLEAGAALPQCWVLELSSFQIETMHGLDPDAATVLNVSDDHLDRYAGIEEYAATKARIFQGAGVQVLNRDDARVAAMALPGRRVIRFGSAAAAGDDYGIAAGAGGDGLVRGGEPLLALAELALAGRHNAANALAALALCEGGLGIAPQRLLAGLTAFRGLPHRVELVAERVDGVRFYDDSKGTNVGATVAALEGMDRPVVLLAGGDGKGQDFAPLGPALARRARAAVLFGRDAGRIAGAVAGCGVALEHAPDLDAAVLRAAALAQAGDAVLLSPACASLDMFRNYAHRAEVFVAAVRRLAEVSAR
ncbi:UDP-N-acetylmuramoyl-L-alanine--D-glutamate ligase [Thauera aromatica]|uniref:UDP-N-acetylmuramoylalanine--D-glutamate ligase n=1 Tax=Thauera aromatica K172 TaxID=44139 RepID=A0A2R4BKX6_THAAR|nr:UDP-N-acetylmuramoyl-L-alanine--D-glutamate ligase [Thauera aromatica]AVR87864.1 UDP-N-acetylmuramoylalanine--D-glutamate ligase [Thauera aromatica K172]MCK2094964.1 UDP-N-acetylmuramoyl-L-alanine--D-glutamate ligase [Thauera aromatica]